MASGENITLKVGESTVRDFAKLMDLDIEVIQKLNEIMGGFSNQVPHNSVLINALTNVVDDKTAEAIIRQGISFSSFMRKFSVESVEPFDVLLHGVSEHPEYAGKASIIDDPKKEVLRQLICSEVFRMLSKTAELIFDDEPIFRKARFVLDVRPLFNTDRDSVIGNALIARIFVDYAENQDDHTIQLQVDFNDVRELRRLCDEAESKMNAIRELYSDDAGDRSIVVPGDN